MTRNDLVALRLLDVRRRLRQIAAARHDHLAELVLDGGGR